MLLCYQYLETCRSGLTYLLAKEAGFNRPREFESLRLRQIVFYVENGYYLDASVNIYYERHRKTTRRE